MNSEKLIEKMLLKYFDNTVSSAAEAFRAELSQLANTAKAEQRVMDAEAVVRRPEYKDAFFSIDSWR